jgi:hypothetical protein
MRWIVGVLAAVAVAGCDSPEPRARTVNDFADDPAMLQGAIARCDADKRAAAKDVECTNARLAMERLGKAEDAKHGDARDAEFERLRAQRRAREEAEKRAAAAANPPFDPYTAPVAAEPAPSQPKL